MQIPLQANCPSGQLVAQSPSTQTSPKPHAVPLVGPSWQVVAPQKSGSLSGSTHSSPQTMRPAVQLTSQRPSSQRSPAEHTDPSCVGPPPPMPVSVLHCVAPQFCASRCKSTHCPSHSTWPGAQPNRSHFPAKQPSPLSHS